MRKLGLRRHSTELPLPAGGVFGGHAKRNKRQGSRLLYAALIACLLFFALGLMSFLGGSPMAAMRRVHGTSRTTLTAEEAEVAGQVRTEALRRREQQWSTSSPPPPAAVDFTAFPTTTTAAVGAETEDAAAKHAVKPSTTATPTAAGVAAETEKPNTLLVRATPTAMPTPPMPEVRLVTRSRQDGEFALEEPDRLPGLQVRRYSFTPAQLLEKYGDLDYVWSFANGSEVNHNYRKEVRLACLQAVLRAENASYVAGYPTLWTSTTTTTTADPEEDAAGENQDGQENTPTIATTTTATAGPTAVNPFEALRCVPKFMKAQAGKLSTLGAFLERVVSSARQGADNRDRETDELRHSIRSLEQHVQWHRGRVVIVSPGHHPTWVDGAKNFLAGVCGDAAVQALRTRGTHLRLTTVHQDAIMPYGMRFTADSHVIEQHMWRVRNLTAVHMYMNDDYFVNRDVAITDVVNEYGGTIVRVEASRFSQAAVGDHTASWAKGAANTEQFNRQQLDVHHEDYLPEDLIQMWAEMGRISTVATSAGTLPTIAGPNLDQEVDIAHHYAPEALPREALPVRRVRHYATHAPFAYCTNMFRFLETRYEREFSNASLHHRGRKARDLFVPFLYNGFVMARPWQASPKFLPYLLQLHRSRANAAGAAAPPSVEIALDNFDGCGPATLLAGVNENGCTFGKFSDTLTENKLVMDRIARLNPLYFNINAGFSSAEASDQLRKFLHDKFSTPVFLEEAPGTTTDDLQEAKDGEEDDEKAAAPVAKADPALTSTFNALMQLPVVGVVSYEEGACPLVRSLSLAFAGHHRGRVHVAVQRHGDGAADETLREARTRLKHRVFSAIPVPQCAFGAKAGAGAATRAETVADVARRVLQTSDGAGVELPSTCGGGSGGLRVRGFVIDARTPHAPVQSDAALREALAMPGQTLALEDFRAVRVGPEERDVVLVLAREDAAAKAVHWITGASESDLLLTYPVPLEQYEDMAAPLTWALP